MTLSRRPLARALSLIAGTGILLTACTPAQSDATSEETITVDTDFGEVAVPEKPQAALGFYTTDVDTLVTLGYPLADEQPVRDGWDAFPSFFPQEELEGINTFSNYPEFDFEGVANARPDFILNGLGYETELHEKLTSIAPTYTYNGFDDGDWRDNFRQLATDLGREAEAQVWFDEYDAKITEIKAELDKRGIDPVVASFGRDGNNNLTAGCRLVTCLVFDDLGLTVAELGGVDGSADAQSRTATLSMEQLGELSEVDVMFVSVTGDAPFDDGQLRTNELWTTLPAVAGGEIYPYDVEMMFGSPSGQNAFLDLVQKSLLG